MEKYSFFALLSRMKYINRWGLMRNARQENLCEHTLEVAYIAHALALMSGVEPSRAVFCALYHDCSEIITGDLPTPIKYDNPEIRKNYREIERTAVHRLLSALPKELSEAYEPCFFEEDEQIRKLVKAADKLSALLKCVEEIQMGNRDFLSAKQAQLSALKAMKLPAVDTFLEQFLPAYERTLDELQAE